MGAQRAVLGTAGQAGDVELAVGAHLDVGRHASKAYFLPTAQAGRPNASAAALVTLTFAGGTTATVETTPVGGDREDRVGAGVRDVGDAVAVAVA